jgi:hypothetical protein
MHASVEFFGCLEGEQCIRMFPGYRTPEGSVQHFREPASMHELRIQRTEGDQYRYDKSSMFFLNFCEDQQI